MKKRIWIISLASLLTIVIIVLLLAPGIIRKMAIKNSKEWVGRQIDIDKLKVNYFTGTIKVIGFKGIFFESTNDLKFFIR